MRWRPEFAGTARFRKERILGEGGFGSVYQVFDRERDERVALKTLHRLDGDALYRFKREFRTVANVSHPALVSFYELFADGDFWYFTMELVRGTDFLSYVARWYPSHRIDSADASAETLSYDAPTAGLRPANEIRLRWALSELAAGVRALHELGVLHRDIKPPNVLVSDEGRVVLLDFGLVTDAGTGGTAPDQVASALDQVVGTLGYMAPEQALGKKLTRAADWYAVGAMLYQALTGRLPHRGTPLKLIFDKQSGPPPAPAELVADVPADLNELAMRLLDIAPETRATGEDIHSALSDVQVPDEVSDAEGPHGWSGGERGSLPSSNRALLSPSWRSGSRPSPRSGAGISAAADSGATLFFGRAAELDALDAALEDVGRGQPVVAEVHGSSGMGKSALLAAFSSWLRRDRSAVVLSGRCFEQESVPYKALDSVIDALCHYLLDLDEVAAASLMPRDVSALSRLFPVLERVKPVRCSPAASADVPDLQELRQRAFSALGELFGRIADRQPLCVVIDDLQWGDADSATLLSTVLTQADPPGMLLILSYRTEERAQSPFLGELLEGTALRSFSRRIKLGELSEPEGLDMARALLGPQAGTAQAAAVVQESGGIPFFVHLLSSYSTSLGRGVTFEEMLSALTDDLPDKLRRMLEVVAVSGQPIEPAVALRAAGLESEGRRTIEALRAGHLLRRWGGEDELLECYHDRLRETVVAELDDSRLRTCHGALARALAESGSRDPERLAVHLEGAGERDEAARAAAQAASSSEDKLAFARAARLYRRCLELGDHAPPDERALRVKLANALANAGLGAEAAPEYLAAAAGASRVESLDLRRRAALQLLSQGHFPEGYEILDEVLTELDMKLSRNLLQALLSIVLQRARLRLRGLGFHERHADEIDAEMLLRADVCWAVSSGLRTTDVTLALDYVTRHLALALAAGEPHRICIGLSMEAMTLTLLNRKNERRATEILAQAESMAARLGDPRARAFAHLSAGMMAWLHSRWREALDESTRAAILYQEQCTGVSFELAQAHAVRVWSMYYCGEILEITRRVPELTLEAWSRGDRFAAICYVGGYGFLAWLAKDDIDATRLELARARSAWPAEGFQLQHYLLLLGDVMVELYCGDGSAALHKITGSWRSLERSFFLRVPAQRAKWFHLKAASLLASALAAPAGSRARAGLYHELGRAVGALERIDFPTARAHAWLIQAGRLTADGEPEIALGLLERATRDFDRLKMPFHAAVATWCLGRLLGGDEGEAATSAACETFAAEQISRPDRVARMLAPGFGPLPSAQDR